MPKSPTLLEKLANRKAFGDPLDHPLLNHTFLFFDLSGNGNGQDKDLNIMGSDADEWVILGDGNDFAYLGGGDDLVEWSAGADYLDGGADGALGDTISYAGSSVGVIVDLNGLSVFETSDAQGDQIFGFENVIGSGFNDSIYGNFRSNSLYGGDGDDLIRGEHIIITNIAIPLPSTIYTSGDDAIFGGAGNDTLYGDDDAARVINNPSGGTYVATFNGGDDTLHGGADDDFIVGDGDAWGPFDGGTATVNGGDDTLLGDAGNDTLIGDGQARQQGGGAATVNGGDDTLDGGTGNDTMWGDGRIVLVFPIPGGFTINGGTDIFVFGPGSGADQIMDFRQSDFDRLDVSAYGFNALSNMTISDNSTDTMIDFGDGNSVTLKGFGDSSVLTEADFILA